MAQGRTLGQVLGIPDDDDLDGVKTANEHRKLDAEIESLARKIEFLSEHVAQYSADDIARMPENDAKNGLRLAHDLRDHFLADKAEKESKRARLYDAALPKTAMEQDVIAKADRALADARSRFDDAVRSGRRLSFREEREIRTDLTKAELFRQAALS